MCSAEPSCRASMPTRVAAHCLPPSGGFEAWRYGRVVRRERRVTMSVREWSRTGCPRRARRRSTSDRRGATPHLVLRPRPIPGRGLMLVCRYPPPAGTPARRYNVRSLPGGSAFRRQCCSFPARPRRLSRPLSTCRWFAGSALRFDAHFDRIRGGRCPSPSSPITRDTRKSGRRASPGAVPPSDSRSPRGPSGPGCSVWPHGGAPRRRPSAVALDGATWLILPVVICLTQRLSHACASMN
ncbi:hypothetical protein IHE45_02G039800 [Dioscorea alata]|uniref:Uncharacterized protein n=1 Tax=Dioscorea alata TaxID=55571 RepID=A0ACB7WP58_DIOAL|nr:hypothetical protein IHE45_02G039800 [Dioscorea alata]